MTQHINLADPRLGPQTVAFGSRQVLLAMLAVLLLGAGAAAVLRMLAARVVPGGPVPAAVAAVPSAKTASAPADAAAFNAEIARLRQLEVGQRRVRAALDAGIAGDREGPAEYFIALARQARGTVWITGLAVTENGSAIDLEGRMASPDALPDYLRRLNAETRFRGRPFAQLSLSAVDPVNASAPPYTEFALHSRSADSKGR